MKPEIRADYIERLINDDLSDDDIFVKKEYLDSVFRLGFKGYDNYTDEELLIEMQNREMLCENKAEVQMKPVAQVTGENGNVFVTLGICSKALKKAGMADKAKEMSERALCAESYNQALNIMQEYCEME